MAGLVVSAQLKAELERVAVPVAYPAGSIVFRRGDPVSGLFLVRSGKVILVLDPDRTLYPTRTLAPGCIAGLPATLSGAAYSLTATAYEDAELGFVSRDDFLKVMRTNPDLCLQTMNLLGQEIGYIRGAMDRYARARIPRPDAMSISKSRKPRRSSA
jgi:CRP-like cAMP-binding protein